MNTPPESFKAAYINEYPSDVPAYWFLVNQQQQILLTHDAAQPIPYGITPPITSRVRHYLGSYQGHPCFAVNGAEPPNANLHSMPLRQAYTLLGDDMMSIAGMAAHMIYWDSVTQYCPRCGHHPLLFSTTERVKRCKRCDYQLYPKISPAIIVRIERGDEILLAQHARYKGELYSVLAGFIEIGESAEHCVAREIFEECGIKVHNIRYVTSQPWPFPNSLMLGFSAEYLSGDIQLDHDEIVKAAWFKRNNLPLIPTKPSIARYLIDQFSDAQ